MSFIPNNPSESFRRRNPHLYPGQGTQVPVARQSEIGKALKQSSKPLLNKTETEFRGVIKTFNPDGFITEQAITFRLANGVRYSPDFVVFNPMAGTVDAYEVKGERRKDSQWATDDARVKLKVAAAKYPFIRWTIAWKECGKWKVQHVKE